MGPVEHLWVGAYKGSMSDLLVLSQFFFSFFLSIFWTCSSSHAPPTLAHCAPSTSRPLSKDSPRLLKNSRCFGEDWKKRERDLDAHVHGHICDCVWETEFISQSCCTSQAHKSLFKAHHTNLCTKKPSNLIFSHRGFLLSSVSVCFLRSHVLCNSA